MKLEYINLARNSIANTSNWILFLPAFDVYVRSFLYLLYTLIKLYYTHTHTHTHTEISQGVTAEAQNPETKPKLRVAQNVPLSTHKLSHPFS